MGKMPLDPRLGLVYGIVARLATRLGGVSELTIRMPSIAGGLLFWFGLWALCDRVSGWWSVLVFFAIAANPWTLRLFSTVNGLALALGLLMLAAASFKSHPARAGLLMGLAIGADAFAAIPLLFASAILAIALRISVVKWLDEVALSGLVVGLLFLLPMLLVREQPPPAATTDYGTREMVQVLMRRPRDPGKVRIAVIPTLEPGLFFYRRRYHLDWLQIVPVTDKAPKYLLTDHLGAGWKLLQNAHNYLLASPDQKPSPM
jgi:hypothetical protein